MSPRPKSRVNWTKSTYSGEAGGCVEISLADTGIAVRDSKNPNGPVLTYTDHEWDVFIQAVKHGEFKDDHIGTRPGTALAR
ncbi:DUF397 domain-containing protein [Sphaerisporangium sp. NPDC049002]|uniref:DUF397 domain-containing protein n=1 Tax=Sphaerisporangium sp. NPDC049002 TaxID=3155392 RepID=UPI0033F9C841